MILDFIFDGIEKFKILSLLSKCVIALCILQTVFNIVGNTYVKHKTCEIKIEVNQSINEIKKTAIADNSIENDNNETTKILNELFDGGGEVLKKSFIFTIMIITSCLVCCACIVPDICCKLTEILGRLNQDGSALKFILLYDTIAIFWDVYTLYGLISL